MKTVWVVQEGSYSDYRLVGVFSSKENAERVADLVSGSVMDVWPVDPGIEDINQGRTPYMVWMERDGRAKDIQKDTWDYAFDKDYELHIRRSLVHPYGLLIGIVFATDEQHAVKIANETRVRYIAEGKWPEE